MDITDIADLDLERATRRGYPEAVYCEGKTLDQIQQIATELRSHEARTLFTRLSQTKAAGLLKVLPEAQYDPLALLAWWPPEMPQPSGEPVVVACAGTSDLPVAREAWLTARFLGRDAELIVDVGVAGLHRIVSHLPVLRRAGAVVVVAGMDGALPSVVAGLVSAVVVAVPTSVGYGAAFDGLAALLSMMNSCAPGVAVVNIDNGYGAGHLAAQITAR
ncbi:MAG: nickel pincer cofactor biosynthesis protein LarB [Propionibacteriaceae bacterium]|jgi:NCAIR mutase (PurE)-related protein|nr:nickel pincer cofactor biosynthesis protein LarB [Propionibacteriaceae bacterium]